MTNKAQEDFDEFFGKAMGGERRPFPYQKRLATDFWPELLEIPTGLGKTAAVVLAWLFRRINGDPDTPQRLVYCLPMRVLVEQIQRNIRDWLKALGLLDSVAIHPLMGGEEDLSSWVSSPEQDMILIGTQDMLLSRALMRGYGMSRYQWPIHFALLHNDTLWVFDEIQLMGAGLPTTAQLEAFRRNFPLGKQSRSLWLSATLHPDWLSTVDFKPYLESLCHNTLSDEDRRHPVVIQRTHSQKTLAQANTSLVGSKTADVKSYISALADEVHHAHRPGTNTIVILNSVERAQALYRALTKAGGTAECLLIHARFRPGDRAQKSWKLVSDPGKAGRIVIATQAIEAGVDVSSAVLFTELAPWSSLVQRFGRCNRYGEYDEARIHWIDIHTDDKSSTELPYDADDLDASRNELIKLTDAGPSALPAVNGRRPFSPVIRRKDLLDLFNTDPDLSGFDVDISMYIRDQGMPQAQVFWREFDDKPDSQKAPCRNELCPVSITQIKAYLKSEKRHGWCWDGLSEQWRVVQREQVRPGQVLMLRSDYGGYDPDIGFSSELKGGAPEIDVKDRQESDYLGGDRPSHQARAIPLNVHITNVQRAAGDLLKRLNVGKYSNAVEQAALWHDVGKSLPEFQTTLYGREREASEPLLAKSTNAGKHGRRYLRHELASMLAWLEHGKREDWHDLVAYLILSHHGKVRTSVRAMPDEPEPDADWKEKKGVTEPLYARGIWEGDQLPELEVGDTFVPETNIRLDIMRLGEGPQGESWTARVQSLLQHHGPFELAWLETLVRIADWRATAWEQETRDE